jgi:hypothetical protein
VEQLANRLAYNPARGIEVDIEVKFRAAISRCRPECEGAGVGDVRAFERGPS